MTDHGATLARAAVQTFRGAHPFDFAIQNTFHGEDLPVLYIVNAVDKTDRYQHVNIVIRNRDGESYTFKGLADDSAQPGPKHEHYHLAIALRPGTLRDVVRDGFAATLQGALADATSTDPKHVHVAGPIPRPHDDAQVWYCAFHEDVPIPSTKAQHGTLTLRLSGISAEAGVGSRSTQLELTMNRLFRNHAGNAIKFSRSAHVDVINHQGYAHAPIYFGTLGSNNLLRGVGVKNTPTVYFETIGRAIAFGPETKIEFSFKFGNAPDQMYFGNKTEVNAYQLKSDDTVRPSPSEQDPPDHDHGPVEGTIKISTTINAPKPLSHCTFDFADIQISGPDGIVMLGVTVRNLPGYWDTDFQVPLIKTSSLELGQALHKGAQGQGSRIDFLSGGKGENAATPAKVSIEEKNGLNLYGTDSQPVRVHTDLQIPNNGLEVGTSLSVSPDQGLGTPQMGRHGGQGTRILLWRGYDTATPYALGINNDTLWYGVPTPGRHSWYVHTQEAMRLDKHGNLGIGTPEPRSRLEVNGTVKATKIEGAMLGSTVTKTDDNNFNARWLQADGRLGGARGGPLPYTSKADETLAFANYEYMEDPVVANTDGLIVASMVVDDAGGSGDASLAGYVGDALDLSNRMAISSFPKSDIFPRQNYSCSIMMPVQKGKYWIVTIYAGKGPLTIKKIKIHWTPLGG